MVGNIPKALLHNSTIIPHKLFFICIPKQKLFAILFLSILHNTKQPLWRQLGVSSVLIGRSNTCLRYKFKLFDREVYPYMIINKTLILPIINVNKLYMVGISNYRLQYCLFYILRTHFLGQMVHGDAKTL